MSFSMLNYGDMQWTTGYLQNGQNGLGGREAVVRAVLSLTVVK